MVLWVDKYRPTSFDKMEVHKNLNNRILKIIEGGDFPHFLFYGKSGSGKSTRIGALLRKVFGKKSWNIKIENKEMKVGPSGNKKINVSLITSSHHIEMTPSESGFYDRYVVSGIIKEIAQSSHIDNFSNKIRHKIIVLNEVDLLTKEAQQALRRTMEKYANNCRLILCATNSSMVIDPIKSRCLCLRVPSPTKLEIQKVLFDISKKENIQLPTELAQNISNNCERNLRRAILNLESTKVLKYPFSKNQEIQKPDYEKYILEICKDIVEVQSPKRLLEVREKIYVLLQNCIPPELILTKLTNGLISKVPNQLKFKIAKWAAFYDTRLKNGSRPIFHLEAFIAKFMKIYAFYLMENF